MRKNHSKIVCIKLVHLPYLYSTPIQESKNFPKIYVPLADFRRQRSDKKASSIWRTHNSAVTCETYCYPALPARFLSTDTHFCMQVNRTSITALESFVATLQNLVAQATMHPRHLYPCCFLYSHPFGWLFSSGQQRKKPHVWYG